jgi:hypothetical protein
MQILFLLAFVFLLVSFMYHLVLPSTLMPQHRHAFAAGLDPPEKGQRLLHKPNGSHSSLKHGHLDEHSLWAVVCGHECVVRCGWSVLRHISATTDHSGAANF